MLYNRRKPYICNINMPNWAFLYMVELEFVK